MNIHIKKAKTWCKKNITFLNFAVVLLIVGILFLIVILTLICKQYFKLSFTLDSKTASELGSFISGFVGVFWTAAGVILVYATFKKQRELNEKQQFEASFFSMLNTFNSIIDKFKVKTKEQNDSFGRDYFSVVLNEFKNDTTDDLIKFLVGNDEIPEIKKIMDNFKNIDGGRSFEDEVLSSSFYRSKFKDNPSKQLTIATYEYIYQEHKNELGYYFRYLYNIFKYVIEENKTEQNTRKYLNIIQSQMSNDELGLLFYNALSKHAETKNGEKQFFEWLEKYDFLENIDCDSLMKREHHTYYKTKFKFLSEEEKKQKDNQ